MTNELKVGDRVDIISSGRIRNVQIEDIRFEAYIAGGGKRDWKTIVVYSYPTNRAQSFRLSEEAFSNDFIQRMNAAQAAKAGAHDLVVDHELRGEQE